MIEWNRVTWYSKLLAAAVFIAVFLVAFDLGMQYEQALVASSLSPLPAGDSGASVRGPGEHCGGFIRGAPTCAAGYRCQLRVSMPDTGGTCVADEQAASSTLPAWAQGMTVVTQVDQGTTIRLKQNERFAVRLGSQMDWTVSFGPTGAITRVANSLTTDGFQGVYEADRAGTATMTALGRPICPAGSMCPQFVVNVTVTFSVGN